MTDVSTDHLILHIASVGVILYAFLIWAIMAKKKP